MKWLKRFSKLIKKPSTLGDDFHLTPEQAEAMVMMIKKTQHTELTCDEVHALLDQYTEMVLAGEDVSRFLPLVDHHLDLCPDCHEEYEALLRIIESHPVV